MAHDIGMGWDRDGWVVSKRRLVIMAVLAGRSQSEVARVYGVSQDWISRLMARYAVEAEAVFEPRSRRPKTSPRPNLRPNPRPALIHDLQIRHRRTRPRTRPRPTKDYQPTGEITRTAPERNW
jgi:hypothetical protein